MGYAVARPAEVDAVSRAGGLEELVIVGVLEVRVQDVVVHVLGRQCRLDGAEAQGLELEHSPVSMAGVTASADLVESGAISGKMLKDLYDLCFERGKDFPVVYEEEGRPQQSRDTSALEKIADELIAANPRQVEQYRAGKKTMIGFFVGQLMKASKGQANPQLVNELLAKKLEN